MGKRVRVVTEQIYGNRSNWGREKKSQNALGSVLLRKFNNSRIHIRTVYAQMGDRLR